MKREGTLVDIQEIKNKYNYVGNKTLQEEEESSLMNTKSNKLNQNNFNSKLLSSQNDSKTNSNNLENSSAKKNKKLSILKNFPHLINLHRDNSLDVKNIIPKSSHLNTNEDKFIKKGEVKKLIEMKMKKLSKEKNKPQNLTPFQLAICNNNLLKEKLNTNKEVFSERAILMKKKFDKTQTLNYENVKHPSSTCTIFNFKDKRNSPNKFREILLEKLKKDDTLFNFNNTKREILPNQGSNYMSNVGFGKYFILFLIFFLSKSIGFNTDINFLKYGFAKNTSKMNFTFQNQKYQNNERSKYYYPNENEREIIYTDTEENKREKYLFEKNKRRANKNRTKKFDNSEINSQLILSKKNESPTPSLLHTKASGFFNKPQTSNSLDSYIRSNKLRNTRNNMSSHAEQKTKKNKMPNNLASNSSTKLFRFSKAFEEVGKGLFRSASVSSADNESVKNKKGKVNFDESSCQTLEDKNSLNEEIVMKSNHTKNNFYKGNGNNTSNLNNMNNNTNNTYFNANATNAKFNKTEMLKKNSNMNSINDSPNNRFNSSNYNNSNSPNNYQFKTMRNFNYNTNSSEIQTSTNYYNPNTNKNLNTLKIDYNKPGKSSSDILSFIMKFDFDKKKRIDPLITQKSFRATSNNFNFTSDKNTNKTKNNTNKFNSSNANNNINKQYKISKEIKKEFEELSFKMPEKTLHTNNKTKNKLSISTGTFESSFKFEGNSDIPNDHIPIPAIFKSTRNSYFKFNKKK